MIGCLCMNDQSACTDARPGQARARAMRAQRHLSACQIPDGALPEARRDATGHPRWHQTPPLGACHTPEIQRLWHTIPIVTASPAV